ncbi:hypothetical protein L195_g047731, partial [Trifolium pratense]
MFIPTTDVTSSSRSRGGRGT